MKRALRWLLPIESFTVMIKPGGEYVKSLHLAVCLLFLCTPAIAIAQNAPQPIAVRTAVVKRDQFVDRVEALGTLRANESVALSVNVTETINAVHFDDGQRLEKGYVLVEMTSAEEHAQLTEARSMVTEAKKQFERAQSLANSGAASRSLLDQRKREFETARAQLGAVSSRMEDRIVAAPFDGVVGLRNISVGALVQPGDQITTIDDDSVMKLDFSVPSTYLDVLHTGMKIVAKARGLNNEPFEGQVTAIDSQIDPVTRSIKVRAKLPNSQRVLKPGLLMTVELLKNPRETLVIPEAALIPQGQINHVLTIIRNGDALTTEKRVVKLGVRRPGEVEILEGVKEGEEIVTHGTLKVQPGQPITVDSANQEQKIDEGTQ